MSMEPSRQQVIVNLPERILGRSWSFADVRREAEWANSAGSGEAGDLLWAIASALLGAQAAPAAHSDRDRSETPALNRATKPQEATGATPAPQCGAWGFCVLPEGHNMGNADVPSNHSAAPAGREVEVLLTPKERLKLAGILTSDVWQTTDEVFDG